VPFVDKQPVQGFSAVLPAEPGSYWVMEDNGFGTKANSGDFLLRVYHVTPHFKTVAVSSVGSYPRWRHLSGTAAPERRERNRWHPHAVLRLQNGGEIGECAR
jgi:hypothetical protein